MTCKYSITINAVNIVEKYFRMFPINKKLINTEIILVSNTYLYYNTNHYGTTRHHGCAHAAETGRQLLGNRAVRSDLHYYRLCVPHIRGTTVYRERRINGAHIFGWRISDCGRSKLSFQRT